MTYESFPDQIIFPARGRVRRLTLVACREYDHAILAVFLFPFPLCLRISADVFYLVCAGTDRKTDQEKHKTQNTEILHFSFLSSKCPSRYPCSV